MWSPYTTRWLLFDGPLQPWWAESLHSALDDSPKLNLASGETLRVPPSVKIFFETHTMENVRCTYADNFFSKDQFCSPQYIFFECNKNKKYFFFHFFILFV
jgi:hypothetical protein